MRPVRRRMYVSQVSALPHFLPLISIFLLLLSPTLLDNNRTKLSSWHIIARAIWCNPLTKEYESDATENA